MAGDERQDSPTGGKTKTKHISPCSLKTCRHVVTVDGTYCMTTGVQLEGPKEVCFDFRASTTAIHHRVPKSQRESRRRRSVTKYFSKSTSYKSFEDAVHDIFGKSPKRKAAQRKVREATIKAVAKLLHKPATLGSAMRAMMAAKQRPVIANGAEDAQVQAASKAIWKLHKRLGLERTSYATIRSLSALFAATMVSKSGRAIEEIDSLLGTDASPAIKRLANTAAIPEVYYSYFDISCRAMSKLWREIKSVAAARA